MRFCGGNKNRNFRAGKEIFTCQPLGSTCNIKSSFLVLFSTSICQSAVHARSILTATGYVPCRREQRVVVVCQHLLRIRFLFIFLIFSSALMRQRGKESLQARMIQLGSRAFWHCWWRYLNIRETTQGPWSTTPRTSCSSLNRSSLDVISIHIA